MLKTVVTLGGGGGNGTGTVTQVDTGTGLTGGPITTSGTVSLANTAVTAGTYGNATTVSQITVDAQGRITSASNVSISSGGVGTVTQVDTGTGLTGGPVTSTGTISLANTAVVAAAYGSASQVGTFTVDAQGRLTAAANAAINIAVANVSGAVPNTVNVLAGTGLSGGGALTANVTVNLANTAVTAGNYGSSTQVAQITIDAQGRITAAANVAVSGGGGGTGNVVTNVSIVTAGTSIPWINASSTILSWINDASNVVTWTNAVYAVTNNNATILVNYPDAPFGVVLPSASTVVGQQYQIKKIDSSANAVTVSTTSSQTIDGNLTYSLATIYKSVTLQSDGSNYYIFAAV
jgi:hypothetical protein